MTTHFQCNLCTKHLIYLASLAPAGVWKLLMRWAVAVPLGYVSLYLMIITWIITCFWVYSIELTSIPFWALDFYTIHNLSEGDNAKEANKTDSKCKCNQPWQWEILDVNRSDSFPCMGGHFLAHSQYVAPISTCSISAFKLFEWSWTFINSNLDCFLHIFVQIMTHKKLKNYEHSCIEADH